MPEDIKAPAGVATKNPGHRFEPGHQRWGGKKKNTAAQARAMADEMGVDPLRFMLAIINSDVFQQTVIVDGKKKRIEVAIPLDTRLDAAKTVINYMYPRLNAQTITGANDGPLEVATLDIAALLANPDMAHMAQNLALAMAEQERLSAGLPESAPLLPAPVEIDQHGYVKK